jgi:hypothetical protein
MLQLNLEDLAARAGRIFRGTVVRIEPGAVEVGGGRLPTLTYTLRVEQAFRGEFEARKGERFATVTTLGKTPPLQVGNLRRTSPLLEIPRLEMGGSYLLFLTPPSAIGLSAPVGLGQGAFRITEKEGLDLAVNGHDNLGLFRGMTGAAPAPPGPIRYGRLADLLRARTAAATGTTP